MTTYADTVNKIRQIWHDRSEKAKAQIVDIFNGESSSGDFPFNVNACLNVDYNYYCNYADNSHVPKVTITIMARPLGELVADYRYLEQSLKCSPSEEKETTDRTEMLNEMKTELRSYLSEQVEGFATTFTDQFIKLLTCRTFPEGAEDSHSDHTSGEQMETNPHDPLLSKD